MSETKANAPTTAELRAHRAETRQKADELAWVLDRLKRQQFDKAGKAELRREWGARDDDNLRHILAQLVSQNLRTYADSLAELHPEAFDPIRSVEELIGLVEAGDPPGADALADELRYVAGELRSREPVTYVR